MSNQSWKFRAKHGRDKLFSSPEILWEAACEYFEWCEEHPLQEIQLRGKEPQPCEVARMRAFTWEALSFHLRIRSLRDYKGNPAYEEFEDVIADIGNIIYAQKFEGAAAGLLRGNFISRELGLMEKAKKGDGKFTVTVEKEPSNKPQDK